MNYKHSWVKKNKIWIWTALNKEYSEILKYVIGDRSSQTFAKLWQKIKHWNCYFWITDGYKVYPNFIPDGDQIVSKTATNLIRDIYL